MMFDHESMISQGAFFFLLYNCCFLSFFFCISSCLSFVGLEKEKETEEEDEKRARELAHKEIQEMKRKELEKLEEERQWKQEQDRLAKEAAAREAERKRLEEVKKITVIIATTIFDLRDFVCV